MQPWIEPVLAAALPTLAVMANSYKRGKNEGEVATRLANLEREWKTNGGSTVKDQLIKVSQQLTEHMKHHNGEW